MTDSRYGSVGGLFATREESSQSKHTESDAPTTALITGDYRVRRILKEKPDAEMRMKSVIKTCDKLG